ncbi:MAG: DUF1501 domain-containing protein [Planctomycetales bacterium]
MSSAIPHSSRICLGPLNRREALRVGLAGMCSLTLPELLRMRAVAGQSPGERTAVILVWLWGGASHLETYDPKPLAPSDYRGPFNGIDTNVPGLRICELLPLHAKIADKFTILRSLVHTGFCHNSGPHQLLTGHEVRTEKTSPDNPDMFCIANYLRHDAQRDIPNYVGVPPVPYLGGAYLGPTYEPFVVYGVNGGQKKKKQKVEVPNIVLQNPKDLDRIENRLGLMKELDRYERKSDQFGRMRAIDNFSEQARNMLTSPRAKKAFDLGEESEEAHERYGRHAWGQQCLLARRLVESGVDLVTTSFGGPLCGRVGNWDDHAVNHHVFDAMKARTVYFDQAVTALIEDIYQRGLNNRVMVVVTGEFGRTPKISYANDSASGVRQPGRDHWPHVTSLLFSGGNLTTGQVIGASDRRGEEVVDRRVGVGDFLATMYRHLGIDADRVQLTNFSGRPIPILNGGKPIPELSPSA